MDSSFCLPHPRSSLLVSSFSPLRSLSSSCHFQNLFSACRASLHMGVRLALAILHPSLGVRWLPRTPFHTPTTSTTSGSRATPSVLTSCLSPSPLRPFFSSVWETCLTVCRSKLLCFCYHSLRHWGLPTPQFIGVICFSFCFQSCPYCVIGVCRDAGVGRYSTSIRRPLSSRSPETNRVNVPRLFTAVTSFLLALI